MDYNRFEDQVVYGSVFVCLSLAVFQLFYGLAEILGELLSCSGGRFILFCSSLAGLYYSTEVTYLNGEVTVYGADYYASSFLCIIMVCYVLLYLLFSSFSCCNYVTDEVSVQAAFVLFSPIFVIMLLGLAYAFGYDLIPFVDLPREWVYIKSHLSPEHRTVFLPI